MNEGSGHSILPSGPFNSSRHGLCHCSVDSAVGNDKTIMQCTSGEGELTQATQHPEPTCPAPGVRGQGACYRGAPPAPPLPRSEAQIPASPRARRGAGGTEDVELSSDGGQPAVGPSGGLLQSSQVQACFPDTRPCLLTQALPLPDVGQLLYAHPGLLSGQRVPGPPGSSPCCDPVPLPTEAPHWTR